MLAISPAIISTLAIALLGIHTLKSGLKSAEMSGALAGDLAYRARAWRWLAATGTAVILANRRPHTRSLRLLLLFPGGDIVVKLALMPVSRDNIHQAAGMLTSWRKLIARH